MCELRGIQRGDCARMQELRERDLVDDERTEGERSMRIPTPRREVLIPRHLFLRHFGRWTVVLP